MNFRRYDTLNIQDKISTPWRQTLKRLRVGALPFIVWSAGVLVALNSWLAEPRASTFYGLARAEEVHVSSPVDGELAGLVVELYQTVVAGEPLATIDDTGLDALIETTRAELARLTATTQSQRASIRAGDAAARREAAARHGLSLSMASLEYPAELRAFHSDEAALALKILEVRLKITTSALEVDRMEVRLRRLQALPVEIVSQADSEDLEQRLGVESAQTENLRIIEAGLQAQLEQARSRRRTLVESYDTPPFEAFPDPAFESLLAGWTAAIVVQQKRLDELAVLRKAHVLRAPASGRVAALLAPEGQFLLAGDPILVLVDPRATDVALWVPESTPTARRVDAQSDKVTECVVQLISPRLEVMPQRLWQDARITEYGRAYLIGPVSALELLPGERVRIDPVGR